MSPDRDVAASDELDAVIAELFRRQTPSFLHQIDLIALYGDAGVAGDAVAAAHRLSGSLGSYGLAAGSTVAARIEHHLSSVDAPDPSVVSELACELRALVVTHHRMVVTGVDPI